MKKLLLGLFTIFTILYLALPSAAFAQASNKWWEPNFDTFMDKVSLPPDNEIFGERYTYAQVFWIFNSLVSLVGGDTATCAVRDGVDQIAACFGLASPTSDNATPVLAEDFRPGPVLTVASIGDAMLRTQPASGVDYVADKLRNFEVVESAYAQGYGYRALQPAQALWVVTRNATYVLFTLAILVIAFLIMFRVKISPQLVISVQSALPKIVMALILVTFSYAIAGLLVDLMYVMQGLVSVMAATANAGGTQIVNVTTIQMLYNLQATTGGILAYGAVAILQAFSGGGFWAAMFGPSVIAIVADLLIGLLLVLVFLIAAIRLIWTLLRAYVTVLLLVIGGPLIILWSTISPGGSVTGWIKTILANLTVFPLTGILIFMAHVLYWTNAPGGGLAQALGGAGCGGGAVGLGVGLFNPYRICGVTYSAAGAGVLPSFSMDMPIVGFLSGLVLMISIPTFANGLKNMILNARADYGSDIQGAIGVGRSSIGSAGGALGSKYYPDVRNLGTMGAIRAQVDPRDKARLGLSSLMQQISRFK